MCKLNSLSCRTLTHKLSIIIFVLLCDLNIVEISVLWRFQYCGDFNIVRFQSWQISILWRFQHCEILISWYFNLRKLCVTSRNLEKWVKRVGRSLRRLGPGGMSRKHASSQNWIKKTKESVIFVDSRLHVQMSRKHAFSQN